jgi:hypothetical protein
VGLLVSSGVAQAATDLCISEDGVVKVQMGTATCSTVAGGNFAIAMGAGASAVVRGEGSKQNRVTATGANADAYVDQGSGNIVVAEGSGSSAYASVESDNNTVAAIGGGTQAWATWKADGNRVTATEGASASAWYGGGNTVTATGHGSQAEASEGGFSTITARDGATAGLYSGGLNNTITAQGKAAVAKVWLASDNVVSATGQGAQALIDGSSASAEISHNTVTATGDCDAALGRAGDGELHRVERPPGGGRSSTAVSLACHSGRTGLARLNRGGLGTPMVWQPLLSAVMAFS